MIKKIALMAFILITIYLNVRVFIPNKEKIYEMPLSEILIESIPSKKVYFDKNNISKYSPKIVLAAIAEHECGALSWQERHLVMEATWNRVTENFNNNGTTLEKQLLSKNQFSGLFKYNTKQFYFDPYNKRHMENYLMALMIIDDYQRLSDTCIFYWAGTCDINTRHWKKIYPYRLRGFDTVNIFA
jgi:hypothetical protein